jgi:hypothetical protein
MGSAYACRKNFFMGQRLLPLRGMVPNRHCVPRDDRTGGRVCWVERQRNPTIYSRWVRKSPTQPTSSPRDDNGVGSACASRKNCLVGQRLLHHCVPRDDRTGGRVCWVERQRNPTMYSRWVRKSPTQPTSSPRDDIPCSCRLECSVRLKPARQMSSSLSCSLNRLRSFGALRLRMTFSGMIPFTTGRFVTSH